jgi:hypothetical protein
MKSLLLQRLSIELTNRCGKACHFCYANSTPAGATAWTVSDLVAFLEDCATNGLRAVSFGGGEPFEYAGVFDVLAELRGKLFRSITTNGFHLKGPTLEKLLAVRPDKVHVSIHFPSDTDRVVELVQTLAGCGVRSGINLLVARSHLAEAAATAATVRAAGIGNDRIVYLPMRGSDTPTPDEVGRVAGGERFQSMSCLSACGPSPRFASLSWDKTVAWCSYTRARRRLPALTHEGLLAALHGLGLDFCGGTDDRRFVGLSSRAQHGLGVVRRGP